MLTNIKRFIKWNLFRFGYQIGKIPVGCQNKYKWLRELNISSVVDIGANTGQFATEIKEWLPEVKIYSFEPIGDVYKQLLNNTSAFRNITAYNMALGAQNGTLDMQRNEFTAASSLLSLTDSAKETYAFACKTVPEQIQIRTLDSMVANGQVEIDSNSLIKIDVQGYESEVLKGGREAISLANIIICEVCFIELYKGQAVFRDLVAQVEALGFELRALWDIDMSGVDGFPIFGDAIFFRKNKVRLDSRSN